jgi:rhamnose utilization protein RhaD (predicted bifunctional aldolase and dehydrogenase)/NAD(P)-dependent dehydrogenase (short-subunit alcohol dehydrogenase family)
MLTLRFSAPSNPEIRRKSRMESLWNDTEAAQFDGDLALRVYTSRLLGRDKSLVLHGGGNTSVKIRERNLLRDEEDILYVKGSGWDLATIEAPGFAPVRMKHLVRLAGLEALTDPQMVNELATHVTRAGSPAPSIEAILHAIIPHKYVDHTHADAVVTVTNTADGEQRIREIYGTQVVVVPYVMPGFDLARECARRFAVEAGEDTVGMVLLNHGIFSFGATARESYERMIHLVGLAQDYLARYHAWTLPLPKAENTHENRRGEIARLRATVSRAAGTPMVMTTRTDPRTLAFARRPDLAAISQRGPITPDHIIRTKRVPMIGRDVDAYCAGYRQYFERHAPSAKEPKTMLDPAPRVVLDAELGLCAIGRSARDAMIVEELYLHGMDGIERAQILDGYRALPERELFDIEYWDLEQAKLRRGAKPPVLSGEVALVTGAASGIGKACAAALLARGAAVIGLDISAGVETLHDAPGFLGIRCDISSGDEVDAALERGVSRFGGLDMLVLNAGIFAASRKIADLADTEWHNVMRINLDANLRLMRECHLLLKLALNGGRVVVIGSKNVPAPGPGAAAYSASKAALNQLARVAALEWGGDGIRVNTLHPNAVFDTAIWTDEVLATRAASYGLTVGQYKKNNVLKVEVTSHDVAELAAELCGPLFAKTTGAQIAVDGGNERVM